jgi:hypothetical protein
MLSLIAILLRMAGKLTTNPRKPMILDLEF